MGAKTELCVVVVLLPNADLAAVANTDGVVVVPNTDEVVLPNAEDEVVVLLPNTEAEVVAVLPNTEAGVVVVLPNTEAGVVAVLPNTDAVVVAVSVALVVAVANTDVVVVVVVVLVVVPPNTEGCVPNTDVGVVVLPNTDDDVVLGVDVLVVEVVSVVLTGDVVPKADFTAPLPKTEDGVEEPNTEVGVGTPLNTEGCVVDVTEPNIDDVVVTDGLAAVETTLSVEEACILGVLEGVEVSDVLVVVTEAVLVAVNAEPNTDFAVPNVEDVVDATEVLSVDFTALSEVVLVTVVAAVPNIEGFAPNTLEGVEFAANIELDWVFGVDVMAAANILEESGLEVDID